MSTSVLLKILIPFFIRQGLLERVRVGDQRVGDL